MRASSIMEQSRKVLGGPIYIWQLHGVHIGNMRLQICADKIKTKPTTLTMTHSWRKLLECLSTFQNTLILQKSAHWSDPLAFASGREIGNFARTEAKLSSLSLINLTHLTLFCRPVVKDCQHVNQWGKMKEMRTELEKKGRMGRNYLVENLVVNLVLCRWWRHISEMV